jgi:hypothetical protein
MGAVKNDTLTMPVVSTAAMPRKRFVSPTGGFPTANGHTIGVNDYPVSLGETMMVDHLGITVVEAGAALPTLGAFLSTDAQGRAIVWAAGAVRTAILAPIPSNVATAAGQLVSVIALPNSMATP